MQKTNEYKKNTESVHILRIFFVIFLVGILFYILNYLTPLFADDYSYSFSYATKERISSVSEIFKSQIVHYQTRNGRSVTHFLAQLFLLAGDNIFNFINVFFFELLLFLVYFHACGSFQKFSLTRFSLIAILLFLSCPEFGQSFLWITGAANYLYGILIILFVMLPYRIQASKKTNAYYPIIWEILSALLFFVLGAVGGWTNENTSVAMIVMMVSYILLFWFKKLKIHLWNITGCVGGMAGCIVMLSSPGNANRVKVLGGSGGLVTWLKRMILYTCDMIIQLHLIWIVFLIIILLYLYQKRSWINKASVKATLVNLSECSVVLIYFLGFLAALYAMIVVSAFPGRVWSGIVILLLIAVFNLGSLVDFSDVRINIGKLTMLAFLLILFLSTYTKAYFDLKTVHEAYKNRVKAIESVIAAGEKTVELPDICGVTGYSCYPAEGDLSEDSSVWTNTGIARYFGVKEIKKKHIESPKK